VATLCSVESLSLGPVARDLDLDLMLARPRNFRCKEWHILAGAGRAIIDVAGFAGDEVELLATGAAGSFRCHATIYNRYL
jgi:hypothetical protein